MNNYQQIASMVKNIEATIDLLEGAKLDLWQRCYSCADTKLYSVVSGVDGLRHYMKTLGDDGEGTG